MARQREYRKIERTPEETARIREIRERIQATKPTIEQLEEQGAVFMPLGEVLALHAIGFRLREEREKQSLSQSEVALRAGMDEPALSRIETGKNPNPTLDTLTRIANAIGKDVAFVLLYRPEPHPISAPPSVPPASLSETPVMK